MVPTMKHVFSLSVVAGLGAIAVACGASQTEVVQPAPQVTWPEEMVTNHGEGPALFIGESPSDAAIGYISAGVEVRITGPGTADRVPVRITGPLKVRGWLRSARLGPPRILSCTLTVELCLLRPPPRGFRFGPSLVR